MKFEEHIKLISTSYHNQKKNKLTKLKPWITRGLIISIKFREKLDIKVIKQPFNMILKTYFIKFRNLLSSLLHLSKNLHFQSLLRVAENDSKQTWKIIYSAIYKNSEKNKDINEIVTNNDCAVTNKFLISNEFNQHFAKLRYSIANKIKDNNFIDIDCHIGI